MKKQKKVKQPIDLENKEAIIEDKQVGKRPFYSANLSRDLTTRSSDTEDEDIPSTDLGGTMDREAVLDQDTVGSTAGVAGHPGIDDDTG